MFERDPLVSGRKGDCWPARSVGGGWGYIQRRMGMEVGVWGEWVGYV